MIHSMTAFATVEKKTDELTVNVEVRSYNSRHIDIFLRMSPAYQSLEDKIKGLITERVARGRIEFRIQIDDCSDEAAALEIDFARADAVVTALKALRSKFNFKNDVTLEMLVNAGGILKPVEKLQKEDTLWPVLKACTLQALDDLTAMRKKEGEFIAEDIRRRLNFINDCLKQIKQGSNDLLVRYQERLKERISILTKNMVELDPARITQEAAFLADRSDISEEIVRAQSHLTQFNHIISSDEAAGRKLNFLLQELNREFNTMGSKIGDAQIAYLVIDVKSEIEKIREQVQNIE